MTKRIAFGSSFLLLLCSLAVSSLAAEVSPTTGGKPHKVLILNSWHQGFPWTDEQDRGVISALVDLASVRASEIYISYLDQRRAPEKKKFIDDYMDKTIRAARVDLIIATDNPAFEDLLNKPWRLEQKVPLVFCGVNNFKSSDIDGVPLVTGVAENFLTGRSDTIKVAMALHPGATRCLFILDSSGTGQAIGDEIRAMQHTFPALSFVYVTEENLDRQIALINTQSPNTIVFPIGIHRNDAGDLLDYGTSMERIAAETKLPAYGFIEDRVGKGMVGGKILTGFDHGRAAGEMAARILNGESVSSIPPVMDNPGRFIFDYKQLARFGLERKLLPPGATVINKPEDFWSEYGNWILTYLLVLALLVALSLTLFINRQRLLRIQDFLRVSQDSLRTSLDEKNTLLKELYHRTKNNLYVIYSLLLMHAGDTKNGETSATLKDMAQRIQAMALVHQKLYQSANLAAIHLPDYVSELVRLIGSNFARTDSPITQDIAIDDIALPLDRAVPVGLILNELVTNAFRHAYPKVIAAGKTGFSIRVEIRLDDGRLSIVVADNGPGLPGYDLEKEAHMGLQTVVALVRSQLKGSLELVQNPGFEFRIVLEQSKDWDYSDD